MGLFETGGDDTQAIKNTMRTITTRMVEHSTTMSVEPVRGVEPPTVALQMHCSAN